MHEIFTWQVYQSLIRTVTLQAREKKIYIQIHAKEREGDFNTTDDFFAWVTKFWMWELEREMQI